MKTNVIVALMLLVNCFFAFAGESVNWTDPETGIGWGFWRGNDYAVLQSVSSPITGHFVIPTKLDGYPVKYISSSLFKGNTNLTSVAIPDSVIEISNYTFEGCAGLTSVTIPDSVTSIGGRAFYGCSGLTSLIIGNSVSGIGYRAFYDCSGLTSVTIPDSVTGIDRDAFRGCSGLRNAIIGNSLVRIPDCLFYDCVGLTSITIPDSVTSIGEYAFRGCSGLTSLIIGNSVTSIEDYAFSYCRGLTRVTIPDSVTWIGKYAFYECSGLTSVTIPKNLDIDSVFGLCYNLKDIYFEGEYKNTYSQFKGRRCHFKREYGASFIEGLGINEFYSYWDDENAVVAEVISTRMQPTNPTVMDVEYIVHATNDVVQVRAMAFEDGVQSFSNIVRAVTFTDDTKMNVGDNVAANVTNSLSWQVAVDWDTDLAQVAFGVIALDGNLLPLYLETVPKTDTHDAITFSWNRVSDSDIIKAFYWLVANPEGDEDLVVIDGVLKSQASNTVFMNGNNLVNAEAAIKYLYGRMGYEVLSGDDLTYVNSVSRLGLSPSGSRQYAMKKGVNDKGE